MPVTLKLELLQALIDHGASSEAKATVDPSSNETLRAAGVGQVTTYIEQLSLLGLIEAPTPLLGADGGMWIGYCLSAEGRRLSENADALRRAVSPLTGGPRTEVSDAVEELVVECARAYINPAYREDFLATLREVRLCFDNECYIASIALCGKLLEVSLKEILSRHGIDYDPNSMMGPLLRRVREQVPSQYLDASLANVASIVNASRITAVHSQERIPVPSRDQTIMVIFATRDVVRRNITSTPRPA